MANQDNAPRNDERQSSTRCANTMRLYSLDDVKSALGKQDVRPDAFGENRSEVDEALFENEHQAHLQQLIARGIAGQDRDLSSPPDNAASAIHELVAKAPHLEEIGRLMSQCMVAARRMGMPASIPPVLLKGPPGASKTWFASQLGSALSLPCRRYCMSGSSLADGLQGSHPSWRNAGTGLVAKTLLFESVGNPIFVVDEFDKISRNSFNLDPYRAFYSLLDPSDSARFVDEYLGFAINASHVLWVLIANSLDEIPLPILDRLLVLEVPEMTREQRRRVAMSVYREANKARRGFFEDVLTDLALDRLVSMTPRTMRKSIDQAMTQAAAAGRSAIDAADVMEPARHQRRTYGFFSSNAPF